MRRNRVIYNIKFIPNIEGGGKTTISQEEELINLRYDLIQTFEIFVRGCKDIEKLKRLTKRYSKYNENNQSI